MVFPTIRSSAVSASAVSALCGNRRKRIMRRTSPAAASASSLSRIIQHLILTVLVAYLVLVGHYYFYWNNNDNNITTINRAPTTTTSFTASDQHKKQHKSSSSYSSYSSCSFRKYPPHRYYYQRRTTTATTTTTTRKQQQQQQPFNLLPSFLTAPQTEYIYGEYPTFLSTTTSTTKSTSTKSTSTKSTTSSKSAPSAQKLCVDQSEWWHYQNNATATTTTTTTTTKSRLLPFADGTNPSILRIKDNPQLMMMLSSSSSNGNGNGNGNGLLQVLLHDSNDYEEDEEEDHVPYYLATICMTNSQCSWKDTPEEMQEYSISPPLLTEPLTVRTILLVLDRHFRVLEETTIQTLMDAKSFGRLKIKQKPHQPQPQNEQPQQPQKMIFALDDARLFTYQNQVWISYREGRNFGYDKQVLHPLHLERIDDDDDDDDSQPQHQGQGQQQQQQQQQERRRRRGKLQATLKASEVETLCCGRNMALLDNVHTHQLQALTWVDPITVVSVDLKHTTPTVEAGRRLLSSNTMLDGHDHDHDHDSPRPMPLNPAKNASSTASTSRRRLLSEKQPQQQPQQGRGGGGKKKQKQKRKSSDFHGTNGFMVHLPLTQEYLGIGHFHRPPGREANEYARFGHHYTHAFFTIPDQPPYYLKRLSPELLLPSHADPEDAEIIQFWSGLERFSSSSSSGGGSGGDTDDKRMLLALAYGINDCEGAATYIDMKVVEDLLRVVPPGKEVVDLLAPVSTTAP